jgi:hypothetical protein
MPPFLEAWHAGSNPEQSYASSCSEMRRKKLDGHQAEFSLALFFDLELSIITLKARNRAPGAGCFDDDHCGCSGKHARPVIMRLMRLQVKIASHDGSLHPRVNIGYMHVSRRAS